jgi:predicted CXXCH cytochrome family protein
VRIIIRYIESTNVQQSVFDGNVATIGRGTDQVIQIADRRLPLAHSKLTSSGGKLTLAANGEHRFTVNDTITKRSNLAVGDEIDISGHAIRVKAGEDGAEFVLEVETSSEQVESLKGRFTTSLPEAAIPGRSVSWSLFAVIFLIGLGIPGAGFFMGGGTLESLRSSPLPDDGVWLTGELHQTHAFMGDDCSLCHTQAFVQTRDEDCLVCHLTVNHHFDTKAYDKGYGAGDQCADCHKEHSTTNSITREDQEVCTDCHADLQLAGFPGSELRPAIDFLEDHPSFKVSLDKWDGQEWQRERVDLWADDLVEESNLIFPHDVHVSVEGIDSPDGKVVMECADCHVPEKGGLLMRPVAMEQHCSDCHQLTFDPATPDRVVPHGSPPELMRTLREYYAYQFLTRNQPQPGANQTVELELVESRAVRRPGRKARTQSITELIAETQIDNSKPVTEQASDFIEARVAEAASNLFEKQTCTICHEISEVDNAAVPWQVTPVKINNSWMPLHVFSHSKHKNMTCEGCHDAEHSADAGDVLMPDLGSCRSCHGGEHADNLLQSTCITCHEFHLDDQKPMGELILLDEAQ